MTATVAFVFAHPDDETYLASALIRRLADEGSPPVLLLATRGDAGQKNGAYAHESPQQLGVRREREMQRAAELLGLSVVEYLGYPDGKLNQMEEEEFVARIAEFLNRHQAQAVVTFPEDGGNGHPDHVTISKRTAQAVCSGRTPAVRKLYYVQSAALTEQGREPALQLDTESYWPVKAAALAAHESQRLAVERFFGELGNVLPEARRYESFALAWENGGGWPKKREDWILDGLSDE
ncbi:N-acetylglucosaminyl deacetylase, LmbE family [Paenibacillus sp. UNCCL117]|uniref:PIG-L deacetylase family protein n=1 Tax=unclassified Paenibacillus TaxID=185978 RepID=UPI0008901F92|nr:MULTISPECIES: PIG-L family deacetylase [unclassified Paenibacillus]SDC65769.1 N-acetylglucosaminyl deacetylase, LmbE family [Paenibacillus sp. cl123]SFW22858.1 N-acetylglucosaminyl deacetylase, LmbE family [Paenibacillus sp. UNCCL117]